MKIYLRIFLSCLLFITPITHASEYTDWRKTGSPQEKLDNLVKAVPGTSQLMLQVAERYRHLYWAAKQGKWEFAEYQIEEMQSLIKTVMINRPKRKTTAEQFLNNAFNLYPAAIEQQNWPKFQKAFSEMRGECLACHIKNDHAFITLPHDPAKSNSLVLE